MTEQPITEEQQVTEQYAAYRVGSLEWIREQQQICQDNIDKAIEQHEEEQQRYERMSNQLDNIREQLNVLKESMDEDYNNVITGISKYRICLALLIEQHEEEQQLQDTVDKQSTILKQYRYYYNQDHPRY
jgi:chromosome segregation ATPase